MADDCKWKASTRVRVVSLKNEPEPSLLPPQDQQRSKMKQQKPLEPHPLIQSLSLLDPILQFLTRASGQTLVPLSNLHATIPTLSQKVPWQHVHSLIQYGILQIDVADSTGRDETTEAPANATRVAVRELQAQWIRRNGDDSSATSSPPTMICLGFPCGDADKSLCGSTKTAAKRRLAALKLRIKRGGGKDDGTSTSGVDFDDNDHMNRQDTADGLSTATRGRVAPTKDWSLPPLTTADTNQDPEPPLEMESQALKALRDVLGLSHENASGDSIFTGSSSKAIPTVVLPDQVSYAGSHPAQDAEYEASDDVAGDLSSTCLKRTMLHPIVRDALLRNRHLYRHQAEGIQSALRDQHTIVCTGTGSGKSLCFLIPVLQRAVAEGKKSLLLFPTKALAQDQLVKLQGILYQNSELARHIRAATLDGDTPHSQRSLISSTCNVVLTNPDTLHACILPNWKNQYMELLQELKYVVIDEAHMYEGVFGAHVAMVLARLYRVHCCCYSLVHGNNGTGCDAIQHTSSHPVQYTAQGIEGNDKHTPTSGTISASSVSIVFLACSATLAHPEHHFRLLCCIPSSHPVTVLTNDASPRAAKHFWVWNPPLLDENGKSLGCVSRPVKENDHSGSKKKPRKLTTSRGEITEEEQTCGPDRDNSEKAEKGQFVSSPTVAADSIKDAVVRRRDLRRRHSADETALLLAKSVSQGVRCIAFCKTRCLVEWVFERCIAALKETPETEKLIPMVDSYRGGYSKRNRRDIEDKLFHNKLLGVVGTSALELGVDIGGVDLTLHCGFPSSHASLLQQAGRAGRGAAARHRPSLAICVCFNSPVDQHLWRHPTSLLSRGLSTPLSMPIYPGLVQGHLLCAGKEWPLMGQMNASALQDLESNCSKGLLSDEGIFGSVEVYGEALEKLISQGSVSVENVPSEGSRGINIFKCHPSIKNPWKNVSIRSIESVSYDIIDLEHPLQNGRMDGVQDEAAVLDNIPYSRIYYHAFPGAIITHRGRRYKIVSMTRPPPFVESCHRTMKLGAYAKPSNHRYFTRPLSNLKITVVKQMERVDFLDSTLRETPEGQLDLSTIDADDVDPSSGSFAGCGVITVKRNVHGYKKVSLVTMEELSRSELCLPDLEYDTFAFWIDCDASGIGRTMHPDSFSHGIHALSHAICNVAPLFVPCTFNDVQCDHSVHGPTRVMICDSRAGGSGIAAQLWKCVFTPKGLIQAAIDLLESCPSCSEDRGYTGGCPACIQMGECIKFNDYLCKRSALLIAIQMLRRIEQTELYKENEAQLMQRALVDDREKNFGWADSSTRFPSEKRTISPEVASPRRRKRERAMEIAKDLDNARERQMVVGRPSWPMDHPDASPQQQQGS